MLEIVEGSKAHKIVMEERICANRLCHSTFRVMNTSEQKTCSNSCEMDMLEDPKQKQELNKRRRYPGPRRLTDAGHKRREMYYKYGIKPETEAPANGIGLPSPVPNDDFDTLSGTEDAENTKLIPDEVHFREKSAENIDEFENDEENQQDVVDMLSETSRTVRNEPETPQNEVKLTEREDDSVDEKAPKTNKVVQNTQNERFQTTKIVQNPLLPKNGKTSLEEHEALWQRYVVTCKRIVHQMNKHRMAIVEMALEVCDINYGGGDHWKKHKDVFTLKKFAEEIGMTYKTLHRWTIVKRNIVDKLPEGYYDEDTDFAAATQAANHTDRNSSPEEVKAAFDAWREKGTDAHYLLQLHRRMRSGAYFITERADLSELDIDLLRELRDNCQGIVSAVNGYFQGE